MSDTGWRFVHFGLLVTGKGEQKFLHELFRALTTTGQCNFKIIGRVSQLSPRTSIKKTLEIMGRGKSLPTRDEEIGIYARTFLHEHDDSFVLLIDDLERDRKEQHREIYERYRTIFDTMLDSAQSRRASVHFLVMMLEAYYFAHSEAVNRVLGTSLSDHEGDVEEIGHPKNQLKALHVGFREITHGEQIVTGLDLEHVLDDPRTCASLRTAVAWCCKAVGLLPSERFRLDTGSLHAVTGPQLALLG